LGVRYLQELVGGIGESEALHALLENTSQMIAAFDRCGHLVYANSSWFRKLGYESGDLLSKPVLDLLHADDAEGVRRCFEDLVSGGRPAAATFRLRHCEGHFLWLESEGQLWHAPSQRSFVVASSRDVTPRRQVEEALRRSQQRLDLALAAGRIGIWEWELETRRSVWDERFRAIFGGALSAGGGDEEEFLSRVHPEDQERLREHVLRAVRSGEPYRNEYRALWPDGSVRHVEVHASVLRDSEGRTERMVGVCCDVTEQKRVERELRASDARFRSLAEHSGAILTEIASDGRVTYVSPSIQNVLGYSPREVAGRTVREFVELVRSSRLQEAPEARTLEDFRNRVDLRQPSRAFHRDGSRRWIETSVYRHAAGEGRLLAVSYDVTERYRLEEELRRTQTRESLGLLAGGFAHDFNNLLAGILGNVELALERVEGGGESTLLRETLEIGRRAEGVIRELLTYAGRNLPARDPVLLRAILQKLEPALRTASPPGMRLVLELGEQPGPWVQAEAHQLRRAVLSLFANAAESLPDGRGTVTLSLGTLHADRRELSVYSASDALEEGDYAFLDVRDDGCGMDPETLARVCDPFFTTKFQGRGLGLASALGIVQSHDGALRFESEPGRGTSVRVLLPLAPGEGRVAPADAPSEPVASSGTVLVVDDELPVRVVASRMLELAGFQVVLAENGARAVELLEERGEAIQAVLLDAVMPVMSGHATFGELRRRRPDLPVLFFSGHGVRPDQDGDPRVGFIEKPFTLQDLREGLRALLP
jgi:two-component system cell cycle sensor histidine kinase/response regulator CckA